MHVAYSLLTLAPGEVGGSETYARGLLGAFAEGAGGLQVTVLAGRQATPTLATAGAVRVQELPVTVAGAGAARLAGLLRGMALRGPVADVLHHPLTAPAPRAAGPSVVTLHDVLHHDLPAVFSRAERAFRRVAYDGAARRATRVVTVSEFSRRRLASCLGLPADRIVPIHHGLDHVRSVSGGGTPDLVLPRAPWVLYPANLWPHKNHERLLAALAGLPGVSLVLTGATYGRLPRLQAIARRRGVPLHHLGYVPASSLPGLYRAATAVVFPSLYEGWGAPVVEAMACGCPVAASDAGAVSEAAGGAALTFAATDVAAMAAAAKRVIADAPLRAELKARGLERAAGLTWRASAERHAEVYADAFRARAASSRASRP